MIYLIIIFILFAISEVLKHQFDTSIFKNLKGNKWWDLRAAELKYHNMNWFIYRLIIPFGDAWHLSKALLVGTIMWALCPYTYIVDISLYFLFVFILYFLFFEGTRMLLLLKNFTWQ